MFSLDTNVILAALESKEIHNTLALKLLQRYQVDGLVISPFVYAELRASSGWKAIDIFLQEANIVVLWETDQATYDLAGVGFGRYAELRKNGVLPRRILADFLIGAHAQQNLLGIITFDPVMYKAVFKKVKVVSG